MKKPTRKSEGSPVMGDRGVEPQGDITPRGNPTDFRVLGCRVNTIQPIRRES